jgi:antitoxin component YwqK of YwqJK toxin-antitoxin module
MPQCKQCGKSGFFLSISKSGFCDQCNFTFCTLVNILNKATEKLNKVSDINTLYSSSSSAIKALEKLKVFDHLCLINPLPEKIIEQIENKIQDFFNSEKIRNNDELQLDCTILGNGYRGLIDLKGVFKYNSKLNSFCQNVQEQSYFLWERFNKISVMFINGFKKGIYKEFYKSGKLLRELPFISTSENKYEIHGIEKTYYQGENDDCKATYVLIRENEYKKGLLVGISKEYGTNGQLMSELNNDKTSYVGSNVVFGVEYKNYYPINGKLKLENYKDYGKEYYENGKLKAEWKNENYLKKGIFTEYYESGAIKMQVMHIDEVKRDGLMHKYYENGTLKELWSYDKGNRQFIKKFFPSEKIKSEWLYSNGELIKKIVYNQLGEIIRGS